MANTQRRTKTRPFDFSISSKKTRIGLQAYGKIWIELGAYWFAIRTYSYLGRIKRLLSELIDRGPLLLFWEHNAARRAALPIANLRWLSWEDFYPTGAHQPPFEKNIRPSFCARSRQAGVDGWMLSRSPHHRSSHHLRAPYLRVNDSAANTHSNSRLRSVSICPDAQLLFGRILFSNHQPWSRTKGEILYKKAFFLKFQRIQPK